jgi:hypothetical protein
MSVCAVFRDLEIIQAQIDERSRGLVITHKLSFDKISYYVTGVISCHCFWGFPRGQQTVVIPFQQR